jgi:hypothetical protein
MKPGQSKTLNEWRDELKPFYDRQGSVYCKAIKDNVVFNSHGWKHLIRHSNGERRNAADARLRLGLLTWIPQVIRLCPAARKTDISTQMFNGTEIEVTYFELCYYFTFGKLLKRRTIGVVVVLRKIGDNPVHYWTVRYDKDSKKAPV